MDRIYIKVIAIFFLAACFSVSAFAQTAASNSPGQDSSDEKDTPKSVKEMLFKMRLEREKKDFQEMLDRGKQASELTERLEKSIESHHTLTTDDKQAIDDVEKLVKKIRGELGGSDDDEADVEKPVDVVSGVKYLRDSTSKLFDELKKSSRFTISAAAIQSSNAVLKTIRFLQFNK